MDDRHGDFNASHGHLQTNHGGLQLAKDQATAVSIRRAIEKLAEETQPAHDLIELHRPRLLAKKLRAG